MFVPILFIQPFSSLREKVFPLRSRPFSVFLFSCFPRSIGSLSLSLYPSYSLSLLLILSLSRPVGCSPDQLKQKGRSCACTSSYNGAVSPASLTIAFLLSSSEHPSYVCLLFVSSCCVDCVSLSPYQCPFDNKFHFPESRRRIELSTKKLQPVSSSSFGAH